MALVDKVFGDIITFTRASGGGRVNALGQFEWVGTNVPRLTYDPVTLQPLGLWVEEQRTNLLLHSANPADVAWTKTSATIGTNVTGPAGLNAQRLVEAAGAGLSPDISQSATVTSGATVVGMRFVKAGERSFARMQLTSTGGTAYAASRFNLADGAKVAGDSDVALNSTTNVKSGSVNYGSGWWMLWLSCTLPAGATSARLTTRIVADASSFGYTGDGVSAIYVGPAQLEEAGAFGSYIPTESTQVTRAADVATVNTLSPWYNAAEGTLVVGCIPTPGLAGYRNVVTMGSSPQNQLYMSMASAGVTAEGVSSATPALSGVPPQIKAAMNYKAGSPVTYARNGELRVAPTSLPGPTAFGVLAIGRASTYSGDFFNGIITSITYYPRVIDVQQASA